MSYNLPINGVFLGVKKPTDPFTFDPNFLGRDIQVQAHCQALGLLSWVDFLYGKSHGIPNHHEKPTMIWVFPKIMVPQNGWFIVENPMKMDDLGVSTPLFLELLQEISNRTHVSRTPTVNLSIDRSSIATGPGHGVRWDSVPFNF